MIQKKKASFFFLEVVRFECLVEHASKAQ